MAQISRPFQIAPGRDRGCSPACGFSPCTGTRPRPRRAPRLRPRGAPASSRRRQAKAAAAPTHVYHGSAPGVPASARAIAKAHGAVATSQQNAKQLEQKSAQASSADTRAAPNRRSSAAAGSAARRAACTRRRVPSCTSSSAPRRGEGHRPATLVHQRQVEGQLKAGNVAVDAVLGPQRLRRRSRAPRRRCRCAASSTRSP